MKTLQVLFFAMALGGAALIFSGPIAAADETDAAAVATYKDVEATFGFVPEFVRQYPKAGVSGAWQNLKGIEFNEHSALPAKVKALISLAVAAQIPCQYCIYLDTISARQAGASDDEIHEAVAMAGLTREWSTIFNGYQVDFENFKREFAPAK